MADRKKSGTKGGEKGAGRKASPGTRSAKPGKRSGSRLGNTVQRKDRWRELVDTSAAWIWETDTDGRHTYTNRFVTHCLGYRPEEFLGLNTRELIHPDDLGLVNEIVQRAVMQKEGWYDQVLRWRHKDGSWRSIESSGTALFDARGAFTGLCGVDRDITEQKQTVEELRRSENKYRDLFENAIDAICITDSHQNYVDVNRRAVELFGYSREELLSMNVRDMLPPGQLARSEEEFAKLIESGAYEKFTGKVRRKDGTTIDVEVSSSAIVEQGRVVGSRDIIRDITDRRQAEALLRDSEERMRTIVERIPVGMHIYRLEPDDRLVFIGANPAADKILGVDNSIFIGKTIEEAFPPLKDTEVPQRYRDVARSGKTWQTESIEYQADTIKGAFEVHAFQTAPDTMVAAFEDITARKRSELALKQGEERYRRLYNETPVLLHSIDRDGRLVEVNDHWLRTLGYERSEVIGRKVTDFYTAASAKYAREVVQPAFFRDGLVRDVSYQFVKKNGEVVDVLLSATGERDAAGNVVRSQAVIVDVTERKRSEQELRESEERYRQLFDAESDAIFLIDNGTGRILMANIAAVAMYGFSEAELLGMKNTDLSAEPSDTRRVTDETPVMKDSTVVIPLRHHRKKDGTVFPVEITGRFFMYKERPVHIAAIRDITDRKKAEEALRSSEGRYRAIVESQTEFIVRYQPGGIITFVNDTLCRYTGMRREDLLGKSYYPFMHPDDRGAFVRSIEAIDREHPSMVAEARVVLPDGRESWHQWAHHAIFDDQGRLVEYQATGRDITERKRAQEELAGQKAMLLQILDTSSVAIFLVDKSGRITQANKRMAEMFGLTMTELIGKEYVELVHPAERETGRAKMLALLASEIESVDLERHYWRKDGTEFWGHLSGRRFHDIHGNDLGLIGVVSDSSKRKLAEDALRKSEKMLQTIIDAEPECVKVLDENACLIMMNRAGLDMLQVDSLDQVKGQCVCPMVTSEYREAFLDLTRRVFRGASGTLVFEIVGAKGRRLWLETHAVPLRDEKDVITAVLGVTRDVTERKRAEEALQRSEARFRSIIEHASSGILAAEVATGRFVYANPQICSMLGYDAEEILTLEVSSIHPPAELPNVQRAFAARQGAQTLCLRKDGSVFPVEIRSVELELDGRQCLVGFFSDISQKQQLEEERIKTQKLESLGTLAGGIAHDFNNLLQGVFGYISMAKMTHDQKEKSLAMLAQAEKALHQSVNLTSQLLTFSKGGKPQKKVIDLRPVIENAVKFALSGSSTTAELHFSGDLRPADVDEGQISQVVHNLVLNADQAMPEGGAVRIAVGNAPASRLPRSLAAGSYVMISIGDSGVGIPQQYLEKIFDPYFTTKEKGSGLGLATSYSIVKNHGGALEVVSEVGKGTLFTIYLPASEEAAASAAVPSPSSCGRTCRVLLMDDEEMVRKVAYQLLTGLDHEVDLAEHGEEAVAKYRRAMEDGRPFDVVILDLTIRGGMGGAEAMQLLREIDPGVKAIVSSGYSDDDVVANYREHGFSGFLKKPYDLTGLQAALNELLG